MDDYYEYYRRRWLNKAGHESTAFVYATLAKGYLDGDVTISDCTRQITLSFYANNKEAYENGLEKLDRLIKTLVEFREAYIKSYEKKYKKEFKESVNSQPL